MQPKESTLGSMSVVNKMMTFSGMEVERNKSTHSKIIKITPYQRNSMLMTRVSGHLLSKDQESKINNEMSIIIEPTEPIVHRVYEPSQKYTMVMSDKEVTEGQSNQDKKSSR